MLFYEQFEKMFGDVSAKAAAYKVRQKVRRAIRNSAARIASEERDIRKCETEYLDARKGPYGNDFSVALMQTTLESRKKGLAYLKQNHARFVAEMAQPSEGFPNGIRQEVFAQ